MGSARTCSANCVAVEQLPRPADAQNSSICLACASPRASTTPELTAQELPFAGGSSPSAGPQATESDGPSPEVRPTSRGCNPTLRLRT